MNRSLDRRTFLRSAGIAMALPLLESMGAGISTVSAGENAPSPRRLVAIGTPFGFDPSAFVPTKTGRDYELPAHLQHIKDFKDDFTVISGLNHPNTGGGGHKAEAVMLTGAPYPDYSYNLRNTISIDQEFATHFRGQTRYDSLVLTTYNGSLSCTSNGVSIPASNRPSEIFARLFLTGTPQQAAEELHKIGEGRSMLDFVGDRAKRLTQKVSSSDRARLEEYFESVRAVEKQMQMASEWVNRPKPKAPGAPPQDITAPGEQPKKLQLMFDMIHLALVTDSTRAVTIKTFGDHHDLSHHGKEAKKRADCQQVETELMKAYGSLLTKLKASQENGGNLLDRTMVLMTSNLRDGNTHWTHNLPVLLAGGGFRHGQHLTFNQVYVDSLANAVEDKKDAKVPALDATQTPLCNLFVSMLQRAGVDTGKFSSSSGRLAGLEMV